jgi:hypothetical protein
MRWWAVGLASVQTSGGGSLAATATPIVRSQIMPAVWNVLVEVFGTERHVGLLIGAVTLLVAGWLVAAKGM